MYHNHSTGTQPVMHSEFCWDFVSSDSKTKKESCSNENGHENAMGGSKNKCYGTDDWTKEKSYSLHSKGSGNGNPKKTSLTK